MDKVLLIGLILISFGVNADVRLEIADNFCHWPKEYDNQDNEHFIAGCNGRIDVQDGVARGIANVVLKGNITGIDPALIVGAGSETPCVMVDSNGTEYASTQFHASVNVHPDRVVLDMLCVDGIAP